MSFHRYRDDFTVAGSYGFAGGPAGHFAGTIDPNGSLRMVSDDRSLVLDGRVILDGLEVAPFYCFDSHLWFRIRGGPYDGGAVRLEMYESEECSIAGFDFD
jgi:hypothetical protein